MKKIYLGVVITVLLIVYLTLFNNKEAISNTKSQNKQITNAIVKEETLAIEKQEKLKKNIIKKNNSSANIPKYKDIFKEPKPIDTLEQLNESQDIKAIEQESEALILEADDLIQKNNLALPKKELNKKEQEELNQFKSQMNDIKNQLEELTNEN
jgi:hypothetical protein